MCTRSTPLPNPNPKTCAVVVGSVREWCGASTHRLSTWLSEQQSRCSISEPCAVAPMISMLTSMFRLLVESLQDVIGVDCRAPIEAALLPPGAVDPTDIVDYREELMLLLSSTRELAVSNARAAQRHYQDLYDKKSKPAGYKLGDWILIWFPHEESGKQRKLSQPQHGPYRVTQRNDPNITAVKVFFPDEGSIQVHQLRVCQCPSKFSVGSYW